MKQLPIKRHSGCCDFKQREGRRTFGVDELVCPLFRFLYLLGCSGECGLCGCTRRPLLATQVVYVRRHLQFCWVHLAQKGVHFSMGETKHEFKAILHSTKHTLYKLECESIKCERPLLLKDRHDRHQNGIKYV